MTLWVETFWAEHFRSLRSIHFPVGALTVFVGENGVGKTNLYRALQLLQSAAAGTLARDLAMEGGMESAHWAGAKRKHEKSRIRLAVSLSSRDDDHPGRFDYSVEVGFPRVEYSVEVGFPQPMVAAFPLEPQIKEESATLHARGKSHKLLVRKGTGLQVRDASGKLAALSVPLMATETVLSRIDDPGRAPELHLIRQTLLDWRFYHDLRTDLASPLRQPCLAITSGTLDSDGRNLAAVFATLAHIREDTTDLDAAIADAFPGARLDIPMPERLASFGVEFPDYPKRVFNAAELSDGTLRFLGLAGALLAYRAPAFIALNEPETSLHGDLLEPLARLIVSVSRRTQIWLVTHSERLASALADVGGIKPRRVIKQKGATWIEGLTMTSRFAGDREDYEDPDSEDA
jgi:predicted ATPase